MTAERKKWLGENWDRYAPAMPSPLSIPPRKGRKDPDYVYKLAEYIINNHVDLADLKAEMVQT